MEIAKLLQKPVSDRAGSSQVQLNLKTLLFCGEAFVECRGLVENPDHMRSFRDWAGALPNSQSPIGARRQRGDGSTRRFIGSQVHLIRASFCETFTNEAARVAEIADGLKARYRRLLNPIGRHDPNAHVF